MGTLRTQVKAVLPRALQPGTMDDARVVVQLPALERLAARHPLRGRVLDAGSGRVGLYDTFVLGHPEVARIDHVDLDPPERPDSERQRYHQGSLTALPFPDATFDAATCFEVLEHIERDDLAAAELGRVLRPGGVLLLSTPTPPAPWDPAHVREGYTVEELAALLAPARLDVVDSATCMHGALRALVTGCRAQGRVVFRDSYRAYLPTGVARAIGRLDARRPVGRPWDVVVAAVRR